MRSKSASKAETEYRRIRHNESSRRYYASHKEIHKKRCKRWLSKAPESYWKHLKRYMKKYCMRRYWSDPEAARMEKREDYLKHKEKRLAASKKYREKNKKRLNLAHLIWARKNLTPEVKRAHFIAERAAKKGIIKKSVCSCGSKKVEAHHDNYDRPLDITWLCRSCHMALHKQWRDNDRAD